MSTLRTAAVAVGLLALVAGFPAAAHAQEVEPDKRVLLLDEEVVEEPLTRYVSADSSYSCRTVRIAKTHRTLLGFVAFRFWQRKHWCWDYPRILSVDVGTYVTDVDSNYQYKGIVSAWGNWYTWCCSTSSSGHVSYRQGRFDNCVFKLGCVGTYYPWVKINAHADGSYTWTRGE